MMSCALLNKSSGCKRGGKAMTKRYFSLLCVAVLVLLVFLIVPARAGVIVYDIGHNGGFAGFMGDTGDLPVAISFDNITPGTDITGSTINGIQFNANSAPLVVVRGADTYTPGGFSGVPYPETNKLFPTTDYNVLSPGGVVLGPGYNPPIENDGLELVFTTPVTAFGFDHLSQSADGYSFTGIMVYTELGFVGSYGIPISDKGGGGAPGGADFWGATATSGDRILRVIISEGDDNNVYPDCNIGYDSFRFPTTQVPEPSTFALLLFSGLGLFAYQPKRTA
jgi:hypothetical protein